MKRIQRWAMVAVFGLSGLSASAWANDNEGDESGHEHQSVTMDQRPDAVQKTLQAEAKGGQIENIKKETEGDKVTYEAEVVSGKTGTELTIAPDGTVLDR